MPNFIGVLTAGFLKMHRFASLVPTVISKPFTGRDGKVAAGFLVVEINRATKQLL